MPLGCCQSLYAVGVRVQPQASTSGRALPVQAFAHSLARNHGRHYRGATYERVLRYPDGAERRIRYPVPTEVGNIGNSGPSPEIHEDWETLNAWKATAPAAAGKRERAGAAPARQAAQAPTERTSRPAERREAADPAGPGPIPASPLQLLRFLASDDHRQEQRREWEEVRGSYEVLEGCPWPAPRPLYVLAATRAEGEAGVTHTQRARLPRAAVEDELTRLLGRRRKDGAPLIRCGEMVDGVIAFEDDADAERYGHMLEQGSGGEVRVARCDSHELFRNVRDVRAVVVLLRRGAAVPQPHRLAAALRGQSPVDADDDGFSA